MGAWSRFSEKFDQRYLKICRYAGVTVFVTFAACLLLYALGPSFGNAWQIFKAVLKPIVWGAVISYIVFPAVQWIDGKLEQHGPIKKPGHRRMVSVIVTFLAIAAVVAFIVSFILLLITRSISKVNIDTLMQVYETLSGDFNHVFDAVSDLVAKLGISIGGDGGAGSMISGFVSAVAGFVTTIVFAIILSIYFMFGHEEVASYFTRLFAAIAGGRDFSHLSVILEDADNAFSGYIRGQFLDALIVGALTTLVFAILDIPYWPVIGVLTGLGNLIPYVGGPIGFGTTIIVCFIEGNYAKMALGVIALAVIMFVDGNVINPRMLAQTVEVHPLLVIIALTAGGTIGGLAGMLIAVPTAALIKTEVDRWMEGREAQLAEGEAPAGEQDAG